MFSISSLNSSTGSDAYLDLLQKQLETARKNASTIDALSIRADRDQKALARERVEEIKKQIEALRRMLMLFGGKDAKAVLQQLKDLASQLKQAAGILKASSETGLPDVTTAAAPADPGDGYAAYAAQQASADAEAATASADAGAGADTAAVSGSVQIPAAPYDALRAEDERKLEAATQALKSLRTVAERMAKQQEFEQRRA